MTAPIVPVPASGFWAATVTAVPALPLPDDTDEIPDTDPAPPVVPVERVPSLPWAEEVPTGVQCPHQSETGRLP